VTDFPSPEMELTQILVVDDLVSSGDWYERILGARLHREKVGSSAVFDFNGTWILLVTGGDPTADKPEVAFAAPEDGGRQPFPSRFGCPTANGHMRN
jgi:catechol 2,3-dioxygenase-like lactoylglutathione lyase family enzyme